ncbi:MAG: hypothetical protein G8D88_19255 [gamma proteobacterium symbiont of Ctena orbiculata]
MCGFVGFVGRGGVGDGISDGVVVVEVVVVVVIAAAAMMAMVVVVVGYS